MAAGASSVIRQRPRQAENVIGGRRKGLDVHSTEWTASGLVMVETKRWKAQTGRRMRVTKNKQYQVTILDLIRCWITGLGLKLNRNR